MASESLFTWIKDVGPVLISWPVIGGLALLAFRRPLLKIIEQFSNAETTEAEFGPVKLKRELVSLKEKVEKQRAEIDTLSFLISNFVTDAELTHLKKLADDGPFNYEKAPYFEMELRRLRAFGLISNPVNEGIRTMPPRGDLKAYFYLTDKGRAYLQLRLTQPK